MKKIYIFTEKNKVFVKIIHIFFLKNIIIFRIVLLHLNNHIGLLLDRKLNFLTLINEKIKKANKGISVIEKLNLSLPRFSLVTMYK